MTDFGEARLQKTGAETTLVYASRKVRAHCYVFRLHFADTRNEILFFECLLCRNRLNDMVNAGFTYDSVAVPMITVERDRIVTDPDSDAHICAQPPLAGLSANIPAPVKSPLNAADSPPAPLTASTTRSPTPEPGPTVTVPTEAEEANAAAEAKEEEVAEEEKEPDNDEEQEDEDKKEVEPLADFGPAVYALKSTTGGRMVVHMTPDTIFKFVAVVGRPLYPSEQQYECKDCKQMAHKLKWATGQEYDVGRINVKTVVETERIVRYGPARPGGKPHLCTELDLEELMKEATCKKSTRRTSRATSARDAPATDASAASTPADNVECSPQASGVGPSAGIGGSSSTGEGGGSSSMSAGGTPQAPHVLLNSMPDLPTSTDDADYRGIQQATDEQPPGEPEPGPSSSGARTASGATTSPVQTSSGRASVETDAHGAQLITCTTAGGVTLTFSVFHKPNDETLWAKCVQCLEDADLYRAANDEAPQIGILIVDKGALKDDPLHPQGLAHICGVAVAPSHASPLSHDAPPPQTSTPSQATPPHGAPPPQTSTPCQAAPPSHEVPPPQTSAPRQAAPSSHGATPPQTSAPRQVAPPSQSQGTPPLHRVKSETVDTPPVNASAVPQCSKSAESSLRSPKRKVHRFPYSTINRRLARWRRTGKWVKQEVPEEHAHTPVKEATEQDTHNPAEPPRPPADFGTVDLQGRFGKKTFSYQSRRHANHTFTFVQTSSSSKNLMFRCRECYNRCIAASPGANPRSLAEVCRNHGVGSVTVNGDTKKLLRDPDMPSGLDHICLPAATADTPPPGPSTQENQLDSNRPASHELLRQNDHDYGAPPGTRTFGADHDYAASPSTQTFRAATESSSTPTSGAATASPSTKPFGAATASPSTKPFGATTASPSAGTFGATASSSSTRTSGAATASPSTGTSGAAKASPSPGTSGAAKASPSPGTSGAATSSPITKPFGVATASPSAGTFGKVKYLVGFKKIAHRTGNRVYRFTLRVGSTRLDRSSKSLIATRQYLCMNCPAEAVVRGRYFVDRDPAMGHSCVPKIIAPPQKKGPRGHPRKIRVEQPGNVVKRRRGRPRKIRVDQPENANGPAEHPTGSAAQDGPLDDSHTATEHHRTFGMAQFVDGDKRKFVYESRRYPGTTFTFVLSYLKASKDYYVCTDCANRVCDHKLRRPPKVFVRNGEIIERDPDRPLGQKHWCLRSQHPSPHRAFSNESIPSAMTTPKAGGSQKPKSTLKRKRARAVPTAVRGNLAAARKGKMSSAATASGSSPFVAKRETSTTIGNQGGASTMATSPCASPIAAPVAQSTPLPTDITAGPTSPPVLIPQPPNEAPAAGPPTPPLPSVAAQPPRRLTFGVVTPCADRSFYYESQFYVGHFFKFVWQMEHHNGLQVMRQYRCHDCLEVKQQLPYACETIHFIMTCDDFIVGRDPDAPIGVEHLCMRADVRRNSTASHRNIGRSVKQELLAESNAGTSGSGTQGPGATHAVHVKQEKIGGGAGGFQAGTAEAPARNVDPKRAYAFEKRAAESDTPVLKKPKGNFVNDQIVDRNQDGMPQLRPQEFSTPGPSTGPSILAAPETSASAETDAPTTSSIAAPQSITSACITKMKVRMTSVNRRSNE